MEHKRFTMSLPWTVLLFATAIGHFSIAQEEQPKQREGTNTDGGVPNLPHKHFFPTETIEHALLDDSSSNLMNRTAGTDNMTSTEDGNNNSYLATSDSPPWLLIIEATIENVNGADYADAATRSPVIPSALETSSKRRSKTRGGEAPEVVVGAGGIIQGNTKAWTMNHSGHVLGIRVVTQRDLTRGSLKVRAMDCNQRSMPNDEKVLSLGPGEGRNKMFNFATPIAIQEGSALCLQAIRNGTIESEEGNKDNLARILLLMRQHA